MCIVSPLHIFIANLLLITGPKVFAFGCIKRAAKALERNHRTAVLWETTVKLSHLTFAEALFLRIAYAVSLATLLFYSVIEFLPKLTDWLST